jgi:hypothetical protein
MKLFERFNPTNQRDAEEQFKEDFVTTFLATWVANHYDKAYTLNAQEGLYDPPVEDAEHLAGKAWEKVQEHIIEDDGED